MQRRQACAEPHADNEKRHRSEEDQVNGQVRGHCHCCFLSEREPSLSSDTAMALLKAQNLLSSAENLLEEDRTTHGDEAGLTA